MLKTARHPAVALFVVLVMSVPAFAHAHLKSATPAIDGKFATSPKELDLRFTEGLNLTFTGIVLRAHPAQGSRPARKH